MTFAEQIKAFQMKRNEAADRQKALMAKATEEGRTLDETESAEYDSISTELKAIDAHLKRLSEQEAAEGESAQPIEPTQTRSAPAVVRTRGEDKFKGQTFVRSIKAKAVAVLDSISVREAAEFLYGKAEGARILKAADPVVAADAAVGPAAQDFVDILRDGAVFDNLPFRPASVGVPLVRQTTKSTGYWVGEGSDITSSKWALETFTLSPKKVGALVPISIEAVRDSSVSADESVMKDLAEGARERLDTTLLSTDAVSASAPAGLRNGAPAITASGTDAADVIADLKGLLATIDERLHGKIELLMRPSLAFAIGQIRTPLNVRVFPEMSIAGGVLEGIPVRVSTAVPSGVIVAVVASEFYAVTHGGVQIDVSKEATIDGTSLFQAGLIGFRALRSVNWAPRRTGDLVAYIHTASYGGSPTSTD